MIMPMPAIAAYQGPRLPAVEPMCAAPAEPHMPPSMCPLLKWVLLPQALLAWNAPNRHMNSLTNPLSPGSPTEAMEKNTMNVAHTGIFDARPPSSFIERVW